MIEDFYVYWLCSIPGIGYAKIRGLLSEFGKAEAIYKASQSDIEFAMKKLTGLASGGCECDSCSMVKSGVRFVKGDDKRLIESRLDSMVYENYINLRKRGIMFTHPGRSDYPNRLRMIYDAPHILYYKGRLPDDTPSVAIIGTRNCSAYGRQMAFMLGRDLSKAGVQVISGLAIGIDTHGHNGVIASEGKTFAVLGSGVDVCYPRSNIELYSNILQNGGILSEFAPGTEARAGNFPVRNRIISGLADVVVVVEAKQRSGSLITVEAALSQNKDVMAVPGRVDDVLSEGCNYLIKQGAHMVTCSADVLGLLGMNISNNRKKNNFVLAREEEKVYGSICLIPKNIDTIIEETGLDAIKVSEILLNLELINCIEEVSKNYYIRRV